MPFVSRRDVRNGSVAFAPDDGDACVVVKPTRGRVEGLDALRKDDLERARTTAPGEKLRQALELMGLGIDLRRRRFRTADFKASDQDIDARLLAWMSAAR